MFGILFGTSISPRFAMPIETWPRVAQVGFEFLLRQLLAGNDEEKEKLLRSVRSASTTLLKERPLHAARERVSEVFRPLSAGFHAHDAHLRFADASLVGLARDLRFSLSHEGLDPDRVLQTGLGYSNLLYLATVLVELDAARDAELTLLLVEEPEAHLHPQLQRATLAFLEGKAKESANRKSVPGEHAGRIQVVVSTHSPNLTAATSIERLVIMRATRTRPSVPARPGEVRELPPVGRAPVEGNIAESIPGDQNSVAPGTGSEAQHSISAPTESFAVAIRDLELPKQDLRKIDRYLDVTKSTLLFGRKVLLVEGIAEALLIPVLAELVLTPAEMASFRAVSVVAIDGVDFEPYVRLLLTAPKGTANSIADRVVVVTDEDPSASTQASKSAQQTEAEPDEGANAAAGPPVAKKTKGARAAGHTRKQGLEKLAAEHGATERLHVELTPLTFEASLLSSTPTAAAAGEFVKLAFASCDGGEQRDKAWATRIDAFPIEERGKRFVEWLKSTGTRKGDFAQALAQVIEQKRATEANSRFPVPEHLVRALRVLVG
ncbi:MAG: AAA family ATPase [Myxococcales bacterium]